MTFNTMVQPMAGQANNNAIVLNLVINGWPSIPNDTNLYLKDFTSVLNLVINGWPSILNTVKFTVFLSTLSFKPCYKWMTFNTIALTPCVLLPVALVLNLVINGWPSILTDLKLDLHLVVVLNLVINGWPSIPHIK